MSNNWNPILHWRFPKDLQVGDLVVVSRHNGYTGHREPVFEPAVKVARVTDSYLWLEDGKRFSCKSGRLAGEKQTGSRFDPESYVWKPELAAAYEKALTDSRELERKRNDLVQRVRNIGSERWLTIELADKLKALAADIEAFKKEHDDAS
jgi:hypothetical protein